MIKNKKALGIAFFAGILVCSPLAHAEMANGIGAESLAAHNKMQQEILAAHNKMQQEISATHNSIKKEINEVQGNAPKASVTEYLYTSKKYGYSIVCPKQPVGIIPAEMLTEGAKGEILVFENEGYNIKHAWVILADAFAEDALPNLNTISEEEAKELLSKMMREKGYEGVMLINLSETNRGIYALTGKDIEIDTDGDGVIDATAHADTQMALTFFRGQHGGRFAVELIDNPHIRVKALKDYQKAVMSFRELRTQSENYARN